MIRLKHTYRLFVLSLFVFAFSNMARAQVSGYNYYKQITINAYRVEGSQSNFPVLIDITDTNLRDNVENSNGYDIVFTTTSSGSTVLSHQIESYNSSTGRLVAWVKVPSISSASNTNIYMFYGNSSVNTNPSTSATWSNMFSSVYHFNNSFADATSAGNNGDNNGSTNTTGKIGNARQFDGNNDYVEVDDDLSDILGGSGTVSAWIRTTQSGNNTIWEAPGLTGVEESGGGNDIFYGYINGNEHFGISAGNGSSAISDNSLNDNQWHYVVFTRNSGNGQVRVYVDGDLDDSEYSETGNKTTPFHSIGRIEDTGGSPAYFRGAIDEFIVSDQIFSSNFIETTYNNQNSPSTFYSIGSQQLIETTPPGAPQNVTATAIEGGIIQIAFDEVDETGSGVAQYRISRGTVSGSYPVNQVISDNGSTRYVLPDPYAADGTTYYYVISAIDAAGNESSHSSEVSATADATSPTLDAATVSGANLTLDYDEILDSGSVPSNGNYTVRVNGSSRSVTNVSISGDQVEITLSSAVTVGDDVEIDYSSAGNPVQDQAGNNVSNFSSQSVTNLVVDNTDPNAPENVSALPALGGNIEISFDDVDEPGGSGVNSYSVKRATNSGGAYTEVGTVSDNESNSYTFVDSNVNGGQIYYYVVTAIDAAGNESDESQEVSAQVDASAPVFEVATANIDEVTLDYSEALDENSIPAPADFEIRVNGSARTITNVDISGDKVYLNFDPSAISGDNVVVDYTAGTNPIQDVAENTASNLNNQPVNNGTSGFSAFGPDPCPIVNGQDAAWACFDGLNNGTSMDAIVGDLTIATVSAASGSQTTFAPNALQQWDSGEFSGDEYNGPQANPSGNGNNATSLDINIPSGVPSDAIILALNRLRPSSGNTSYTLEAFDSNDIKLTLNDWDTGQGTDGGVCTNTVNLVYTNGNTTLEFRPSVSGNPVCSSSSTPIWFRITDDNVARIELRKVVAQPDNIHFGMAIIADFGDAPTSYRTTYSSNALSPAFHLLSNTGSNPVYFGGIVDADGNGMPGLQSLGDDSETTGLGNGDDEDAISIMPELTTDQTSYNVTLVCTDGARVGGWVDFDRSGSFDASEFDSNICSSGSVMLSWSGLSGLTTGTTHSRFRIGSRSGDVANPTGSAIDGEVEDYKVTISEPHLPDLAITETVDNSQPIEGDEVTFTIQVTNNSEEFDATGVQVADQLPSGITYVSYNSSQGSYDSGTGVWNIGSIATQDTVSLEIVASVDTGIEGTVINNSAAITFLNETDPDLSNNSTSAGITVVPKTVDLAVSMIVDEDHPLEGQTIVFTLTVNNLSNYDATNLKIIDQIPTGLSYSSASPNIGTYNNSTGIWNIGTLQSGNNASMTLTVEVDDETIGNTIPNSAAVNAVDQNDPNTSNNTASVDIEVITPGTPVSCSEIASPVFDGNTRISGNDGELGAVYLFEDVLPGVDAEVEIISINNAALVAIDQSVSGLENNFQPQIEAIDKDQDEGFIDFEFRFVQAGTSNPKFLTFRASAVDVDGDNVDTREFVGFQRLTSFVVEGNTNLIIGTAGVFTTFESATSGVIDGIDPQDTNNLSFTSYTNEPQFRYRAGIKDPTNSSGEAAKRLFALSFEPCIIDNFDDPQTTDIVDLKITKEVNNATPEEGEEIIFTIEVENLQGNSVGSVSVEDELPNELSYVSSTASMGSYSSYNDTWTIGSLSGFQTVTLTIVAEVDNNTEGDSFTNTARIKNSHSGTDGNVSNNEASVDMYVPDPNSTSCSEPPLFSFSDYTFETGVAGQVNAVYRYNNIGQGLDALVKIKAINNAILNDFDAENLANDDANFSPLFTATSSNGYIDWEITFVATGTNNPVKKNLSLTGLDIDGSSSGGGSIRDYLGFAENQSSVVENGTNLSITEGNPFQLFESSITSDGQGSFDTDHMAYIKYNYTSRLQIRTGSFTTGGYQDDRLVDIDFTQCRLIDFDNPTETTRNADLEVTKTVDNANPLQNESVNFTINVTNHGSKDATEVDISEEIPDGLTLIEATPSQGTYNQLSKVWAIGTLANGNSATLNLEVAVAEGAVATSITNTAYVLGLNQFDPDLTNNADSATVNISIKITGIVFEDKTGNALMDGDTNLGDASGDQQGRENVRMLLFKDGGDGIANGADDSFEGTTTTDNSGNYTFQSGENATYWIAADSRTGGLSNEITWAQQTYAPEGGICTDGSGSETVLGSAGNCFGGRTSGVSDNISVNPSAADLANAQHVAKVVLTGSQISGINFGFSFNVVTNIDDGDDDGSASRSIQGSLRQFIQNANEISGANTMRFVPVVPTNQSSGGGNWWSVTLSSELPTLTDALTTINGTAYDMNAPLTKRDSNPGSIGSGGNVGVGQLTMDTFTRKELEINLNDAGSNAFRINSSGAVIIREIALYNNTRAIRVHNTASGLIENNLIGARADGSNPGSNLRAARAIEINGSSSSSVLIQNNYIAYSTGNGVESANANATVTFFKNEVYQNGLTNNQADGLQITGAWTIEQNLIHENGNNSSSPVAGGSGIEFGTASGTSQNIIIRGNTLKRNSTTGITVRNQAINSLIEGNLINENGLNYAAGSEKRGAGVKLTFPDSQSMQGIKISENSFFDNHGISIDIVTTYDGSSTSGQADGVTPNDGTLETGTTEPNRGIDYPVFTLATFEGSQLRIQGFIGTNANKISGTYTIEIYKADDDANNDGLIEEGGSLVRPHGEGKYFIGTITTNSNGTFNESISIPGSVSLATNDRITAIAIGNSNNTSEFSSNQRIVPTGVTITGYVYKDTNHNTVKESGENGIQYVTIVLYNEVENNCKSVLSNSDGFYQFTNVLNGDYQIIEAYGQSVPTPDVCLPDAADPDEHVSTSPNVRSVEVNNLPATMNFGDFEGSKIQGTVFNDNGIGSGVANDAIQNGSEAGLSELAFKVKVTTSGDALIEESAALSASGEYTLFVPKSQVANGGTVKVVEISPNAYISTGGDEGTTGGAYDIATDVITFTITSGEIYTGINFADVQISNLLTDGQQNQFPGATAAFTHQFTAKTSGTVVFDVENGTANSNPVWPVILYQDQNCSGTVDSGEPILDASTSISVSANQTVCLVLKITVPLGVESGASNSSVVRAEFTLATASPQIQQMLTRTDLVIVSETDGGLIITKAVDKPEALPGALLTYTISYQNNGNQPISSLKISDNTPAYTSFEAATCTNLPNSLTNCTITDPGTGGTGIVKWEFNGNLQPGSSGVVTYIVKIYE